MEKSSLIEILRTFSKEELAKFSDFCLSPYHNKKSNVTKLYKALRKYAPEFPAAKIKKEKMWKKVFPGKKYNYGVIKNLIFELNRLAEHFLTTEGYSRSKLKNHYYLLNELMKKNAGTLLSSRLSGIDKLSKNHFLCGDSISIDDDYETLGNIYALKTYFNYSSGKIYEQEGEYASAYLSFAYLITMMRLLCNINVMRERKTNTETHSPGPIEIILNSMGESGFNQLLEYTREKLPEHYGIVNCYYRMYRTFEFTGGEEYFEFKKTFMELSNKLPRFSVYDLYINLENALVKISPDELRYPAEQFELMNFMETNHTLLNHEGIMREITWIKYVLSAFSLKNKAEIKRFTETYKNSLSPGFEETCRGLSRTLVLFLEEKYTESLKEVSFLNSTFQPVNLVIKEIKIMIHYETGDYESLEYAADTHRQFVKYKKRAKIIKSNNSFGSQVLRLFKIKESLDALKLAELKQEKVSGVFTSNEWFREKLEQTEALIQGKLTGN